MDIWVVLTFWLLWLVPGMCECVFISLGYKARSGIAGSCGYSVFNLVRNYQTLQSGCPILHSHQQCKKVPIFSTSLPTLLTLCLININHAGSEKWYLTAVSTRIFLMGHQVLWFYLLSGPQSWHSCPWQTHVPHLSPHFSVGHFPDFPF